MKRLSFSDIFFFLLIIQCKLIWQTDLAHLPIAALHRGIRHVACLSDSLEKCLDPVARLTTQSNLSFPINNEELKATCNIMDKADKCTSIFIKMCAKEQINVMYSEMLQGTKHMFDRLCTPGKEQDEIQCTNRVCVDYLKYAECFKTVSLHKCHAIIQKFHNQSMLLNHTHDTQTRHDKKEHMDDEEQLRSFCCDYKLTIECQEKGIKNLCSPGAVAYFHHYITQMSKSVLTDHCASFIDKYKCRRQTIAINGLPREVHKAQHNRPISNEDIAVRQQKEALRRLNKIKKKLNSMQTNDAESLFNSPTLWLLTVSAIANIALV